MTLQLVLERSSHEAGFASTCVTDSLLVLSLRVRNVIIKFFWKKIQIINLICGG